MSRPAVGAQVLAELFDEDGAAWLRSTASVSFTLSCGCYYRPSDGTDRVIELRNVGSRVICDRCDDYAVVMQANFRLTGLAPATDADRIVDDMRRTSRARQP